MNLKKVLCMLFCLTLSFLWVVPGFSAEEPICLTISSTSPIYNEKYTPLSEDGVGFLNVSEFDEIAEVIIEITYNKEILTVGPFKSDAFESSEKWIQDSPVSYFDITTPGIVLWKILPQNRTTENRFFCRFEQYGTGKTQWNAEVKSCKLKNGKDAACRLQGTLAQEIVHFDWPVTGDADGDARVTAADARIALRVAVLLETHPGVNSGWFKAVDIDQDGLITAQDARSILRLAVGLSAE